MISSPSQREERVRTAISAPKPPPTHYKVERVEAPAPSWEDETDDRSFFQRYGFVLGVGGVVLTCVGIFVGNSLFSHDGPSKPRRQEISMVRLLPPPPPPPPPPVQKPPEQKIVEQKMMEQVPVEKDEQKPDDKPPQPDVGTNIKGDGPGDAFGLSGSNGNGQIGGGGRAGSRWGWYAAKVQTSVGEALRRNPRTRDASLRIEVRIWPDATGRITRAQLAGSSGDPAVDAAIRDEVLTGLQLPEPPPQGMPAPIVMRVTAQRPK